MNAAIWAGTRRGGVVEWTTLLGIGVSSILAFVWLVTGGTKLLEALAGHPPTSTPVSWADQFPSSVITLAAIAELGVGVLICLGSRRAALLAGIGLLSMFSLALVLWPLPTGRPCGCAGSIIESAVEWIDPRARNLVFGAAHCLALAAVAPLRTEGTQPSDPGESRRAADRGGAA